VLLENTYVPSDLEEVSKHLDDEELEELKKELEKEDSEKFPEIDKFREEHPDLTYIKVDKCTNKAINTVFHSLIQVSRSSKNNKTIDSNGHLVCEADIIKKIDVTKTKDANLKAKGDINSGDKAEEGGSKFKDKRKKCQIF
jgi:hypothetical protein